MQERGAAVVIPDAELGPERLRSTVTELLGASGRLEEMAAAAAAAARPDAAARVAEEVMAAAGGA
jgi:UDP-N-acetylglucosamine--N-acetylmuramyl-(pentapeptide) pyrophosphoryl-undecaprenol N-acetylglucosamine transferase